jgi:hypothetical protein
MITSGAEQSAMRTPSKARATAGTASASAATSDRAGAKAKGAQRKARQSAAMTESMVSSQSEAAPRSAAVRSPFPPIAEYAFLSNCHTGALIAPDGSGRLAVRAAL